MLKLKLTQSSLAGAGTELGNKTKLQPNLVEVELWLTLAIMFHFLFKIKS